MRHQTPAERLIAAADADPKTFDWVAMQLKAGRKPSQILADLNNQEQRLMPTLRIHYADGTKVQVDAQTAAEARKTAERRRIGIITKVKLAGDPQFPPTTLAFAVSLFFGLGFCIASMGIPA